ncbi:helix-turn-helix domain-containing protein [Oceanobacillus saliphilus]|uniref:helix-turn-helix domain-containing protein n=1 Tax=Oceanobacillus saliphilus TaxID=2925834 RepID=UPI00201DB7AB|nr:helix-turn-helix domain-containing protein [Oceanobacillus saliphilus]
MKRKWLIQFRKSKNLTQEDVASAAFIDRAYYSQVENGRRNPGLSVAQNIGHVLNFDPMMFFQEHLQYNNSSQNTNLSFEISDKLKSMESGEILYLYNSLEIHDHHIITFFLNGREKGSKCLIIDNKNKFNQIKQRLENLFTESEIENHIYFISKEEFDSYSPKDIANKLKILQHEFENSKSIRIWFSDSHKYQNDCLLNLNKNIKDIKKSDKDILFIHTYNASVISAGEHIQMMRAYPFLMTDKEIVNSPFYNPSNQISYILPSLFIQDNK